mmetsp:Transcript_45774/g.99436  ORF Transcript_45774/g.99436 Transcript_45774/m.99436 type:complete len:496 (+) Transcript_45774:2-1489(+)
MHKQLQMERKKYEDQVAELKEEMKRQEEERKKREAAMHKENAGGTKKEFIVADEESSFSDVTMMKRILKLAFLNTIQRRHIKQHQKNIEVFEQAFATIKSTTGISDIEEIVKIFVRLEERNFSLLTYVNQINREIEALEKRNNELQDSIRRHKDASAVTQEKRKIALSELEQQVDKTQRQSQGNNDRVDELDHILKECWPIVRHVVDRIKTMSFGFGTPPSEHDDNILIWLSFVERSLTQWRELLPENPRDKHFKPFPFTVPKNMDRAKKPAQPGGISLRANELPAAVFQEATQQARNRTDGAESDSSEEDYESRPLSKHELKQKVLQSLTRKRQKRNVRGGEQATLGFDATATKNAAEEIGDARPDGEAEAAKPEEESATEESTDEVEDPGAPTDDDINEIFLKRYKMSKEELQAMADRMGIQLNNLCYLKQEFDAYDEDRSGYIDAGELKELLEKLGEELTEEELDAAFKELDSDQSGEIEFFEFVEWFTSED